MCLLEKSTRKTVRVKRDRFIFYDCFMILVQKINSLPFLQGDDRIRLQIKMRMILFCGRPFFFRFLGRVGKLMLRLLSAAVNYGPSRDRRKRPLCVGVGLGTDSSPSSN